MKINTNMSLNLIEPYENGQFLIGYNRETKKVELKDPLHFENDRFYIELVEEKNAYMLWTYSGSGRLYWDEDRNDGNLALYTKDRHTITDYMLWTLDKFAEDIYNISNKKDSSMVLDVSDAKYELGTVIQVHKRNTNTAQLFRFKRKQDVDIQISTQIDSNKVISTKSENTDIVIWDKDSGDPQKFKLDFENIYDEDVCQIWTGDYKEIVAWNTTNGQQVFTHTNENKSEHYWKFERQTERAFNISNLKDNDYVLELSKTYPTNGDKIETAVKAWSFFPFRDPQKFYIETT